MFEDIVNDFPKKTALDNMPRETWNLYLFEEELKSILRTILFARGRGHNEVYLYDVTDNARVFLEEKGYNITALENGMCSIDLTKE